MPSPSRGGRRLLVVVSALSVPLLAGLSGLLGSDAEESPAKSRRAPWTTSRVVGSPDPPPPFKVVRAFPNLKFHHPLLLARSPGGERLFVGEQAGVLYSFPNRPDAAADVFFDLGKELKTV